MVDPTRKGYIDIQSFRTRLPTALKLALRNKRSTHENCSVFIDIFTAFHTVANLIYVISLSFITRHMEEYETQITIIGAVLTFLGLLDLLLRINLFHILPTSAVAKLSVFDIIASVACLFSIYGK